MSLGLTIDIIIIFIILIWGISGFKRGVLKQGVMTLGTVIMFVVAFYLKNPVAEFLSLNLPFINITKFLGSDSLNIIFFQLVSFIIVVCLLEIILKALIKASGIIEKLLRFTIVLGIPSKLLGLVLGLVEGFVIVYVVLFFISQPLFNLKLFDDSKVTPFILNDIPVLSNIGEEMVIVFNDLYDLGKTYEGSNDNNGYNLQAIDTMLKHDIITVDYVDKLVEKDKIHVTGLDTVLNKYR